MNVSKANVPADFSAASVRSDKGGDSSFWVSPSHDSSFEKKTGRGLPLQTKYVREAADIRKILFKFLEHT